MPPTCPVDLSAHQDYHRERLLEAVKAAENAILCVDPNLTALLELVLGVEALKADGALPSNIVAVHHTNDETFACDKSMSVIFIVQSRLRPLSNVVRHIRRLKTGESAVGAKKIYLYVVPRDTLVAEHILASKDVKAHVHAVKDLDLDLAVLDKDLLSMELTESLRELTVESDQSVLDAVAKAVVKLQVFYGPIIKFYRMGAHASGAVDIVTALNEEAKRSKAFQGKSSLIQSAFFFDRRVDPAASVFLQSTYSGMLAEYYPEAYKQNVFRQPDRPEWAETVWETKDKEPIERLTCDSSCEIWKTLRDVHCKGLSEVLKKKAQEIVAVSKTIPKDMREYKDFLAMQPVWDQQIRMVKVTDTVIAQLFAVYKSKAALQRRDFEMACVAPDKSDKEEDKRVVDMLEAKIYRRESLIDVWRWLCMYSHGVGGLKPKMCEALKTLIIQVYGIAVMAQWDRLERSRLLSVVGKDKSATSAFPTVVKELQLYDKQYAPPFTTHQVLSGYCPVVPKIMERTVEGRDWVKSWLSMEKHHALFAGDKAHCSNREELDTDVVESGKPRVVLVFFVGGVTHGEIGALRILQDEYNRNNAEHPLFFLIATTAVVTGDVLIRSLTRDA